MIAVWLALLLASLPSLNSSRGSSSTRSVHIDCHNHDKATQDPLGGSSSPDLLVLEHCSLHDINFWVNYFEKRFAKFYTLWLKAVKTQREHSEQQPTCSRIHTSLEKLVVSSTAWLGGGLVGGLVACTPNLLNLHLTDNTKARLTRIPAPSLLRLNASNSGLSELLDNTFSDLVNLQELDLSRNKLVKISSGLFRSNRRLETLHLQHNSISFINRQSFLGLRHLRELDLGHNDIASMWLKGQVFHHLNHLTNLNLSNNRLTDLDTGLLLDLPRLEVLDLSANQMKRLARAPFQNQSRLSFLSLRGNHISGIDGSSLHGLTSNLQTLILKQNKINFIQNEAFRNLTGLRILDLSLNHLGTIPPAVKYLSALTELNLGENEISELNGDFMLSGSTAAGLTVLGLRGNTIKNILPQSFNSTPRLESLDLGDNRVESLDAATFVPLVRLRRLSLAGNLLTDINGLLTSHPALTHLNVSNNQLKWFDMAFFPKQLERLEVQMNHIEALGNYYKLVEGFSLRSLDASNNRISALDQHTFVDSIEEINLSSNNISDLGSGNFGGLVHLRRVDLRANSLVTLPQGALKINNMAGSAPEFLVSGNPLVCDCELEWLSTYSHTSSSPSSFSSSPFISDYASLVCAPPLGRGEVMHVHQVPSDGFVCEYSSHCFSLCRCCTFLACDCRMQCPDPCNCFHDQSWNLNMIQCGSRNLSVVLREIPMDSTILYLDNNQLTDLGTEKFLGRNRLSALYLNHSGVATLTNRTFLGLWGLKELHLEHNNLVSLPSDAFEESSELQELYLHNNQIRSIGNETFFHLAELRVLTLHSNQLATLAIDLSVLQSLDSVTLGRNPWTCSCELSLVFYKMTNVSPRVGHIACDDSSHNQQNIITFHSSCKDLDVQAVSSKASSSPFVILLLSTIVGVVVLLTVSVFLVIKRNSITTWIYSKASSPKVEDHSQYSPMLKVPPPESLKRPAVPSMVEYSAYLHYCLADDAYVKQVLGPKLESVDSGYKICLHHRDLPKSCTVGQAIGQAVANSQCLLILASPAYFMSSIPTYELQMILSEVLPRYTSYPVVVAVSKASIPDMRARLRQLAGCQADTWTYLEASDILFYDRVVNLVQAGGGGGGLHDLSSDASSCSTKSTAASSSTLPPRISSPRVISNPLERLHGGGGAGGGGRLQPPPSESIYSTVLDTASEGEGEVQDPTYQTVYADQTLYIDTNLTLVKTKPSRFRTLQ